jgi:hypothetical protein
MTRSKKNSPMVPKIQEPIISPKNVVLGLIGKRKRSTTIDLDKLKKWKANKNYKEMFTVHKINRADPRYQSSQTPTYEDEDYGQELMNSNQIIEDLEGE